MIAMETVRHDSYRAAFFIRYGGNAMPDQEFEDSCSDMTEEFTLNIPCVLAARAEAYAKENETEITNVVIEALDHFLRING